MRLNSYITLSHPERAFGEPKRDLRPALHNCTPMVSCVSGSEETSENCVGGFRFIFLVFSNTIENSSQTSEQYWDVPRFKSDTRRVAIQNILKRHEAFRTPKMCTTMHAVHHSNLKTSTRYPSYPLCCLQIAQLLQGFFQAG